MIAPEREIRDVEKRIAARRAQLKRHGKEAAERALQALASPLALAAAAGMGFLAARAMAKRRQRPPHPERRKSDHLKSAKATGVAGVLLSGAMWLVRAQWGSPAKLAQAMLEKWQSRKSSTPPRAERSTSPKGDRVAPAQAGTSLRQVARP